ncbi:helix-turn-helix transcriptional regulator [Hathewaya massiliensis]|uniref:helix-turn-helix transcriptional regulator n=1 Tax=Hathewaya massiliensis TaxID=1964382 RepID=UPI001156DBC5|nr:helix-turn-helix transcriptional regulator [Hathewaya massiliensis]
MRRILKEKREKMNYTQKEIAHKLNISRATYTNIENGNRNPSFNLAMRIKEVLSYQNDNIFLNE